MPISAKITGVDRTRETLRKYAAKKHTDFRNGIIAAALFLESSATLEITDTLYAQPEPPEKVRKRTGNLRASRFTVWTDGEEKATPAFQPDPFALQDVGEGHAVAVGEAKAIVQDHKKNEFLAVVAYGAYYALYVHEGTEHMQGYKWLSNALNKDRDLITACVKGGLGR